MRQKQEGFILVSILLSIVVITIIGIAALQLASTNLHSAKVEQSRINTQFTADAGIDHAIKQLNQDATWKGQAETTFTNNPKMRTTYQTVVRDGANNFQKFIDVEAKTFTPSTAAEPSHTRKYTVEMRGVGSGSYSIVSGVGGLNMVNNSKILGGEVYVNGRLSLANSAQIGLSILPVPVRVADQSCPIPANSTYPRVCNPADNAGQPITFSGNSKIYGNVQATNQTNGNKMYSPGLVPGNPPAAALPTHDRAGQIARATNTMTGSSAGCTLGARYWPANTRITGDVTIGGICIVTVGGDVWIEGNLRIENAGIMMVQLGTSQPPNIMIDGNTGLVIRNAAALMANINLSPVGFRMITYASNASCSPNCTNVTGADLYNSKDKVTISIENAASAAEAEFYARWSKIRINNAGNIGALAGQTVELSNAAAITFGTQVSGFGGPTAWVVKSYKRTY